MTRLITLLLGLIAPSERFPVMWARLNRGEWPRAGAVATRIWGAVKHRLPQAGALADDFAIGVASSVVATTAAVQRVAHRLGERAGPWLDANVAAAQRLDAAVHERVRLLADARVQARLTAGLLAATIGLGGAGMTAAATADRSAGVDLARAAAAGAPKALPDPIAGDQRELVTTETTVAVAARPDPEPAAVPAPAPVARGALPIGKGMWLYVPERVEGGDPHAIVRRAQHVGITHLYVRTGSSKSGFYAQEFLDRLLPVAHANGIRVYGWDFPYFDSWSDDVFRALAAIQYTTPDGHRIDGFSADIETWREGTKITAHHATEYGAALRKYVGPGYPLIATVPRPNPALRTYPFAEVVQSFDAIAPMVYWMHLDSGVAVAGAMDYLAQFGKPIIPIGQVYDGGPEGGPPGVPSREQIIRFMQVAEAKGAIGVSFWSWQHADQQAWDAVRDAAEFRVIPGPPEKLTRSMVVGYQAQLNQLGFPTPVTGAWDPTTVASLTAFQAARGLPTTGVMDEATFAALFAPEPPPIQPAF